AVGKSHPQRDRPRPEKPSTRDRERQERAIAVEAPAEAVGQRPSLGDGTYSYGQVPQSDVLGREYLVFQVEGDRAVGAIYLPRSEFNCFAGRVDARQLSLSIADDYSNDTFPLAIALVPGSPLASSGAPSVEFGLQGYHRLDTPSTNDLRILSICRKRAGVTLSESF
ncbi:MAG: hypothetical protein AAFY11_10685, partial [Cyanobacteria bacterium J06641_5]